LLVVQHDFQRFGTFHHVVIGCDVAVRADDHAGAGALLQGGGATALPTRAAVFGDAEQVAKSIRELVGVEILTTTPSEPRSLLGGLDVHNGGQGLFGSRGEAGGWRRVDVDRRTRLGKISVVRCGRSLDFNVLRFLVEAQVLSAAQGGEATNNGGQDDEKDVFHLMMHFCMAW